MPRIKWDQVGEKFFETGVDQCVLFLQNSDGTYADGVGWNGITAINENPSGADEQKFYADNIVYGSIRGTEDFGATIEAFTYPDEFEKCDGSATPVAGVSLGQQSRKPFGLVYRTLVGNDTDGTDHGYKLHFIYNATVSPSEKNHETVNDSPEMANPSWDLTTTPIPVSGTDPDTGKPYKPTSHVVVDSTKFTTTAAQARLKALEDLVYGVDADATHSIEDSDPTLPTPNQIITMLTPTGNG